MIRKPPRGPRYRWPLSSDPVSLSPAAIFNKDLLATLHLLVALAKRFQPRLPLPPNVQVEVITMEVRGGHGGSSRRVSFLGPHGHSLDWGVLHGAGAKPNVL